MMYGMCLFCAAFAFLTAAFLIYCVFSLKCLTLTGAQLNWITQTGGYNLRTMRALYCAQQTDRQSVDTHKSRQNGSKR